MKKKKKLENDNKKSFFDNKNDKLNIFVVKTTLKSILKDFNNNFIIINNLVKEANECVIRTYQFIRLYFLYCYYNNLEFIEINKDNVLYFMRALSIRDNRGIQPKNTDLENKLNNFYENEFSQLINKPKFNFINKSYLNAYIGEHIATSFNNNIKEHFITRFRYFLNIIEPNIKFYTDNKELIKERKRIYNLVKNSILNDDINEKCPEEYKKFALKIRNIYLPSEYEKSFYYDCKKDCNFSYYLKQTIKMNEVIEKYNNTIDKKIININGNKKSQIKKRKEFQTMKKKLLDDEIKDFYYNKLFRKLKFRTNVYLRKSEDKFLNNIEKVYGNKEDIVIGYGDWSEDKQIKHLIPSSNIGLRRKIEKRYKVFLVNEYCTSKLCSCCNKELKNYKMSNEDIKKYENKNKKQLNKEDLTKHRLLVCHGCSSSENKKSTFWNRDINACVNMLKLSKEWINNKKRNPLFCRNSNSNRT